MFITFQPVYPYHPNVPTPFQNQFFQSDLVIYDLEIPGSQSSYVEYSPMVSPFSTLYGKHVTGGFVPTGGSRSSSS